MNKSLDYKTISVVVIVFLVLLYFCKSELSQEGFSGDVDTSIEKILGDENMSQRNKGERKEALFRSVDKSIEKSIQEQGELRFENADTNPELLDEYINKILISDQNNPNAILKSGSSTELPSVFDDDYQKYNHEIRQIIFTKQIKQNYLVKVLRHKIDLLLNSLKPIEEIKSDLKDLEHPENDYLIKILERPETY
jgi:hypothetical protein